MNNKDTIREDKEPKYRYFCYYIIVSHTYLGLNPVVLITNNIYFVSLLTNYFITKTIILIINTLIFQKFYGRYEESTKSPRGHTHKHIEQL